MRARLDVQTVARLRREALKTGGDGFYWDDALPGFGLRLRNGQATYIVQYRARGKTRRPTIGNAAVLNVEQARKKAKEILAAVVLGHDPQQEKRAERARAAHTFFSVATEEYLPFKQKTLRTASFKVTRLYLTGGYFKPLHNMPLADIEPADVAAQIKAVARKHSDVTALAARRALSAFFTWSAREGLMGPRPSNPVTNTNTPPNNPPRERVLNDAELAAIWKASEQNDLGRIVKLLTLTGCRRREIGGMMWPEINFEKKVLALPAERVKNKRSHVIPLTDMALDIIRSIPRRLTTDSVFGQHRVGGRGGFFNWTRAMRPLEERSGVQNWRLHDIRRSVATGLADLGVQPHIIEQVLNHAGGHKAGVAGIYNRSTYEPEVRAALEKWAARVADIVNRPRLRQHA
jgi:integrase